MGKRIILKDMHNKHVSEMNELAKSTLKILIHTKNANAKLVQDIVKIFYHTDDDLFIGETTRDWPSVEMRRLYMFIRHLYFGIRIRDMVAECGFTRANIYYHCRWVFNQYDYNDDFRKRLLDIFSAETMENLRVVLESKQRGRYVDSTKLFSK